MTTMLRPSPPARSGSQSSMPVPLPEMHLGSIQDLQLNDFGNNKRSSPTSADQVLSSSPPRPVVNGGLIAADRQHSGPDATYPDPAASPSKLRYAALPPGAAPPTPGGTFSQTARQPSDAQQPPAAGLPTPPASQGGPRHPSAAQQAGQVAGVPNPTARPRQSFVQAPTYPTVTPLPMSLQGLIASESPLQAASPPPAQQQQPPPQKKAEEEVCIECMMRDRDMADVDVTSPGVWARASDADYEELVRREEEEALADARSSQAHTNINGTSERRSTAGTSSSSHGRPPRGRARGGRLTEENVRRWLLMNPKDHEARWRTITRYVKAQSLLLEQELRARERTETEARAAADQARTRYNAALRLSTGGGEQQPVVVEGVRGVRVPTTPTSQRSGAGYFGGEGSGVQPDVDSQSIPASPARVLAAAQDERDVLLLPSGLEYTRVDLTRNTSGRARSVSVSLDKRTNDDRLSTYSTPMPRYPSPPIPETASFRTTASRPIPRHHTNNNGERRSVFGGLRASLAGSVISLTASRASVVNLHGQQWEHERMPGRATSPSMPTLSPTAQWPSADTMPPPPPPPIAESIGSKKTKKRGGIGKIFGGLFSSKDKASKHDAPIPQVNAVSFPPQQDDLNAPLAPPPPIPYLLSRKSGELNNNNNHQRQQSNSSLLNVASPPTAPSSILPSPTSNRFSWRQSNASLDMQQFRDKDSGVGGLGGGDPDMMPMPMLRPRYETLSGAPRPHTLFLTEKSLPPLPPEAASPTSTRPGTTLGFRSERSASFSALDTYSGSARFLDAGPQHARSTTTAANEFGEGERKSKFGLASLLGKRNKNEGLSRGVVQDPHFVAYRYPSAANGGAGPYQQAPPAAAHTMPMSARR